MLREGALALAALTWAAVLVGCDAGANREPTLPAPPRRWPLRAGVAVLEPDELTAMGCLTRMARPRLRMEYGHRGCFGGADGSFEVDVRGGDAIVRAHVRPDPDNRDELDRRVPVDRARAFLRRFVAAAQRPEVDDGTWTSTKTFASISFWCDGEEQGPVTVETDQSDARFWGEGPPGGYARANGVTAVVREITDELRGR